MAQWVKPPAIRPIGAGSSPGYSTSSLTKVLDLANISKKAPTLELEDNGDPSAWNATAPIRIWDGV